MSGNVVSMRLSEDLVQRLRAKAQADGVNESEIVRAAVGAYLDRAGPAAAQAAVGAIRPLDREMLFFLITTRTLIIEIGQTIAGGARFLEFVKKVDAAAKQRVEGVLGALAARDRARED